MFTRLHGTDVLCCPKYLEFVMDLEIEYAPDRVPPGWLVAGAGGLGAVVVVLAVVGLAVIA